MRLDNVKQPVAFYALDMIISVGYRVNSKRGIEFRRWANKVLKDYIIQGYAANENRLRQLQKSVEIMSRAQNELESGQILSIVEQLKNVSILVLLDLA